MRMFKSSSGISYGGEIAVQYAERLDIPIINIADMF